MQALEFLVIHRSRVQATGAGNKAPTTTTASFRPFKGEAWIFLVERHFLGYPAFLNSSENLNFLCNAIPAHTPPPSRLDRDSQLLAMWLSWVRALHTFDGTLRLSRPLFHAIKEWGGQAGQRERGRGWGKVQWIPVPPNKQQQRYDDGIVDGDGAARTVRKGNDTADAAAGVGTGIKGRVNGAAQGVEVESSSASNVEGKGVSSTPETENVEEISQARRGEGVVRKERDSREGGKTSDTASVCIAAAKGDGAAKDRGKSTGGQATDDEVDAEAMVLKAEREEREKVLELVEKLVADFGRFPPAEQEWEGVEEEKGRAKAGGETCSRGGETAAPPAEPPTDGGAAAGPRLDDATGSSGGGNGDNGGVGIGSEKDELGIYGHSNASGTNVDVCKEGRGGDETVEDPLSDSNRKALALKIEGNESFRNGNLEAARDAYTTALDILEAAAEVAPPQSGASQSSTSGDISGNTSRTDATVLRGVLHRNRAAVALRMFESKATAAAAAAAASTRDVKAPTHHAGEATTRNGSGGTLPRRSSVGGSDICSVDLQSQKASAANEQPGRAGDPSLPPAKENRPGMEEVDDARQALELSLALLEGCESDCLKAIEVDAGDKKACLRLERCRELRRRCYRTGLASAAVGKAGRCTGYSRQDERYGFESSLKRAVNGRGF